MLLRLFLIRFTQDRGHVVRGACAIPRSSVLFSPCLGTWGDPRSEMKRQLRGGYMFRCSLTAESAIRLFCRMQSPSFLPARQRPSQKVNSF